MIFKGSTDQIVVIRGLGLALPTHIPRCSAFLICLSYRLCPIRPCGAPSPRGEGCDTRIPSSKCGEAATFIPNSSFEQSFHSGARDSTPYGLPPPLYLISQNRSVFSFAHFVSTSSETPMYCASALAT